MCHRSQASERFLKDLSKVYDVGDLVKAVVLKVTSKTVMKDAFGVRLIGDASRISMLGEISICP